MNHHDYSSHRFSALEAINKSNVRTLKFAFAVALGGKAGNENLVATPLVDDGFMYMTDAWGVVYKIDVRSGTRGDIVWKMDPGQETIERNRGVALWGNLVISVTGRDGRVIATDKESGKIVWDRNLRDQPDVNLNAAPLALKDEIIVGATGGGAFYVTGSYDPDTNVTYWGAGNPSPKYDSSYRPGDNLYTNSALAIDAATGKMRWYHQYTPNDTMDYDESGSHILIDTKVNGEDRKLVTRAARNGFAYSFDRHSGQFLKAAPYVSKV